MSNEYVLTTDDNGDLAIRTVVAEESSTANSTDVITATTDGKLAVRVVGSGGGDQHNLGWYATQSALETAHPTAEAGDWAIVGSTDTVWLWDTDNEEWVDSDQKGQVTSVNGQTGVVSLGINDVAPTQTGKSGYVLGTDGFVAGWVKPEIVQVSAVPVASEDEADNIYQFVGTTDANYTNGYFYKCVSDGQNPATYSWTRVDVQPTPSGLPDQTGNAGKFLTTDGTDASWATVNALQNNSSQSNSIVVSGTANTTVQSVVFGAGASATTNWATVYGATAQVTGLSSMAIGNCSVSGQYSIYLSTNSGAKVSGSRSLVICPRIDSAGALVASDTIVLGSVNNLHTLNSNTFYVGLDWSNSAKTFELLSPDGTIPTARLTKVNSTITLAAADWSAGTQTVTVNGITATSVVWVSPDPSDQADYVAGGILCTAQAANSLTFTASTTPTNDIDVVVVAM